MKPIKTPCKAKVSFGDLGPTPVEIVTIAKDRVRLKCQTADAEQLVSRLMKPPADRHGQMIEPKLLAEGYGHVGSPRVTELVGPDNVTSTEETVEFDALLTK